MRGRGGSGRAAAVEPRGEIVLVVGRAGGRGGPRRGGRAVRRLVESGAKPRVAASVVAELTGLAANDLYRATLESAPTS